MVGNLPTDGDSSLDHPLPPYIAEHPATSDDPQQREEELHRIRQWAEERHAADLLSAQALSAYLKNLGHSDPESARKLFYQVKGHENQTREDERSKLVDDLKSLRPAERESEILRILSDWNSNRDELVACVNVLLEGGKWLYPWKLAQYQWQFLYLKRIAWVAMNTAIEDVSFAGVTVGIIMSVSGFTAEEDIAKFLNTWIDWSQMISKDDLKKRSA